MLCAEVDTCIEGLGKRIDDAGQEIKKSTTNEDDAANEADLISSF